jgi:uncharacterized HhH-GPD family protein
VPTATVDRLHFTGDPEADAYLVREPLALLIGFVLDQQVTVQTAFRAPLELRERIGGLDAARIAAMDASELEEVFTRRPRLHRYARMMAQRTQKLCQVIARDYGGDAQRVWTEATDGQDLERRLLALPGIGPMKSKTLVAILGKRLGVRPQGWEDHTPDHPTLGDVDSSEALERYQTGKRAARAAQRETAD